LLGGAKRLDEAETDYMALTSLGDAGLLFILAHGAFLERRGRRAEAIALYARGLQQAPGDAGLAAARERAARRGKAPPLPTVRQGAARAILPFATAMMGERQTEMALAYVRMSLYLDPTREDARVLLGDVLGAPAGVLADRFDNRRLLITTSTLSGLIALSFGTVTAMGHASIWMVYGFTLAFGLVLAVERPTMQAFVYQLVGPELLPRAVAANGTINAASRLIGPALAGVVLFWLLGAWVTSGSGACWTLWSGW